jgi:hypothetical protein
MTARRGAAPIGHNQPRRREMSPFGPEAGANDPRNLVAAVPLLEP